MIIAIDYDGTYTLNPKVWNSIILHFKLDGVEPILVTYRHKELDRNSDLDMLDGWIKTYYTDGKAKGPFMEALGIKVDIWIEDNPKAVYEDSAWQHDSPELHAWREENKARNSEKSDLRLEDQTLKVA